MNKIIFLSTRYFTEVDFVRFGINRYLKNNIAAEIWYLNKLVKRDYKIKEFKIKKKIKIKKIQNIFQFENQIKKNVLNCLYDLRLAYHFQNKEVFQLLSKYGASYLIRPGVGRGIVISSKKKQKYLIFKLKKIIDKNFFNLKNVILNKFFLLFIPRFWSINKAKYVYLIGKYDYLNKEKHKLVGNQTRLIWGQHRNYDDNLREYNQKLKIHKKEKKALFIDQAVPYHPDAIELDLGQDDRLASVNPDEYYNSIRIFLEKLNKKFGYKIEISCHPRLAVQKLKKFFPRFAIKISKTIQQIRSSSLIIMHESTAIDYVVMYNKPIIFITNNSLNNADYPHYDEIFCAAKLFNKKCINIDTNSISNITNHLKIDKKMYRNYFKNFIKFKGPKKLQADIIVEKLKKDRFWV